MSWESLEFRCQQCGEQWDDIIPRSERDTLQECPECGMTAGQRMLGGHITKASYVDGTKRWTDVKTLSKLRKAKQRAFYERDTSLVTELGREIQQVRKSKPEKVETNPKINTDG